jgi:hypothetical protein
VIGLNEDRLVEGEDVVAAKQVQAPRRWHPAQTVSTVRIGPRFDVSPVCSRCEIDRRSSDRDTHAIHDAKNLSGQTQRRERRSREEQQNVEGGIAADNGVGRAEPMLGRATRVHGINLDEPSVRDVRQPIATIGTDRHPSASLRIQQRTDLDLDMQLSRSDRPARSACVDFKDLTRQRDG